MATDSVLQTLTPVPLVVAVSAALVACWSDLRTFRVPNLVTLPLLGSGLVFHWLHVAGGGLAFALCGAGVGFCCLIVFYVLGAVGAGDVKLLTAVGAWIGPAGAVLLFLLAALLAGLYAAILTYRQGMLQRTLIKATFVFRQGVAILKHLGAEETVEQVITHDDRRKRLIPFGAMIFGAIALLAAVKLLGH